MFCPVVKLRRQLVINSFLHSLMLPWRKFISLKVTSRGMNQLVNCPEMLMFLKYTFSFSNCVCSLERTTTSILDIIFEIQDLERFSVINHLGKFHNRAKTIARPIPQRYVVGIQMPTNLPEPLHCLPL